MKDDAHAQMNLSRAFLALGLEAMRRDDLDQAETWLQKCQEVRRPFECFFATGILKMSEHSRKD